MTAAWAWLTAVSLSAAVMTAWDKHAAKKRQRRLPERVLWLTALCGGSAAMWLTMLLVRHKTRHRSFMWGLPVLMAVQAVAWICWLAPLFDRLA